MSKFNLLRRRPAARSPIVTVAAPGVVNHQGGAGHVRDAKSELFLLAVANMVGEDTFYEAADDRDSRYAELVRRVALKDPQWTSRFLRWLRTEANMRSASLVGAAEFVKARLDNRADDGLSNRAVVASVLQRADEPGELIAYWFARYGRRLPKPVKRGVADAVRALYDERSFLKWDSGNRGVRFADVLRLVHPAPRDAVQDALFEHILRDGPPAPELTVLTRRRALMALPVDQRRAALDPAELRAAGMTWEALAGWLQGPLDAEAWQAVIPGMGYMACLAEGTPIWLPDGTTAPIEEVVRRRLPVLAYDKEWDTRPVKYGANQGVRDRSVGTLVPTVPTEWIDAGTRRSARIRFVSGRVIIATVDHRWIRQRTRGRKTWEWATTADLVVGDRIPAPLTASYFGEEGDAWDGYFVGAMMGDGGMTSVTPEFHGDPDDGAVAFMREFATKLGCRVVEQPNGKIVRLRFPYKQWKRNPVTEVLRHYGVWGLGCANKALPDRPFSREFWVGLLSGLIDTDGCVRLRTNAKGTRHATVEIGTISSRLAEQVADALLRLGVTSTVRRRSPRDAVSEVAGRTVVSRHDLYVVEVSRATAVVKLAELLELRISYKATRLAEVAEVVRHVQPATSEMHGYDESVALDRIVGIEDAGEVPAYCVRVEPSHLFVANGLVTGNCLRNVRNFDEAAIPDEVADRVAARLADPGQVARSRQFPFRFLSAYRSARSSRWDAALERALDASLANVPSLPGRTLILIDRSASMWMCDRRSAVTFADQAAVFGCALAMRAEKPTVVVFGWDSREVEVPRDGALLPFVESLDMFSATNTAAAVRRHYRRHDRVVLLTDEQAATTDASAGLPRRVPLYVWNVAGYRYGGTPSGLGNRHTFGGLTDAAFRMIPLLEAGRVARWPF